MRLTAHGRSLQIGWDDPTDHIAARIIRHRAFYEQDLLEDIYGRLKTSGTAVDVGAHIGNHTLWLAGVCGLEVVAIEPDEVSAARLRHNIAANDLAARTRVIQAGAGATPHRARVETPNPQNSGMNRLVPDPSGVVEVITIDSLELSEVRVIKIDVEGGELGVLAGAKDTIARDKPLLYIEASTEEARARVRDWLAPLGYEEFGRFALTPTYGFWCPDVVLSTTIMAHPKRRKFVRELRESLDGDVRAVWDKRNDRWDTGRRAMGSYDKSATHHLVIQDDSLVCKDLLAGVRRALALRPESPVSFYLGSQRPHGTKFGRLITEARRQDASWAYHRELCWGVAVAIPTHMIDEMIRYADRLHHVGNYDMRMSYHFERIGIPTWYTIPSLVDHRRGDVNPSLVPGRTGLNRVAYWFLGTEASALDVQLTTRTVLWNGNRPTVREVQCSESSRVLSQRPRPNPRPRPIVVVR